MHYDAYCLSGNGRNECIIHSFMCHYQFSDLIIMSPDINVSYGVQMEHSEQENVDFKIII